MPIYEKLEPLGHGSFGEVWLVYEKALDAQRAVKFVRPQRINKPTDFFREPRILKELRHDNIVRVEDAGRLSDGTLYIAMEYLPKGSVDKVYKGNPVFLSTARGILCDVCWGLEFAHNNGYLHCDIKPGNILLADGWKGKLSDFGLALPLSRGAEQGMAYSTHVAPEYLETMEATVLTDVYALGVTAYRLLNGDAFLPTFETAEELESLIHKGKYPDRKRYRPCIPKSLRRIVNKAMHIEPSKRYQNAMTMRCALERVRLHCSWVWRSSKKGVVYQTKIDNCRIKVCVKPRTDGKFDIETTRKPKDGAERRVRSDCHGRLALDRMKQCLHMLLSRYVEDGL